MVFLFVLFLGFSLITSAITSARILPQYSQRIIFLFSLISACLWGGTILKQPPHALLETFTTAKPFLCLSTSFSYESSRLDSIFFEALFFKVSSFFSSPLLSSDKTSRSDFLAFRVWVFSLITFFPSSKLLIIFYFLKTLYKLTLSF